MKNVIMKKILNKNGYLDNMKDYLEGTSGKEPTGHTGDTRDLGSVPG